MNPHKFIGIAQAVAAMSKDTTKVGAVCVDDDGVVLSLGYNGEPRGVLHLPERFAERQTRLLFTAHAESNCIAQAARAGHRLYGSAMVIYGLFPCNECAKLIINAGIKRVIAPSPKKESKWYQSNLISICMFNESGVEFICHEI